MPSTQRHRSGIPRAGLNAGRLRTAGRHSARHARPAPGGAAYGTTTLLRLHARTGWRPLLGWPLGLAGLVVATGRSIVALYPGESDRLAYAASVSVSPGAVAFNGKWTDLETVGGITTNEVGFLGLLLFPVAGVLLAIGRTRREEDSGRIEILTARPVGRLAPLAAGALAVAASIGLFGVLSACGLAAVGLPPGGAIRYAALLASYALAWAGIGLLCAEVSRDARTASGLGLALVLAVFVAKAVIDGAGWRLAWATPMGWLPEAAPFGSARWWPYAALLALAAATTALAVLTAARRDLSGGLLAPRSGPAHGSARLGTPFGYAWRLTRGAALGWLAGLVVWGAAIGSLTADMTEIVRTNPQLLEVLGVERPEDLITSLTGTLAALGAAALAVQGVGRLAGEEDSGRLGLVLAAAGSRRRLWIAWGLVLVADIVAVLVVQALAFGATAWWATGAAGDLTASLGAALVLAVGALFVLALALAIRAVLPQAAGVVWAVIGWSAIVGFLAETLDLPGWARDCSPFHLVGQVPVDDPRWPAVGGLAVATLVLAVASVAGIERRDLRRG